MTTTRNTMLEALQVVLEGIDGVRHVARQDISSDLVADAQMPAILIAEGQTRYSVASRHGKRNYYINSAITLDIQVRATRTRGRDENNASQLREAMVDVIINTLANNPTLKCKLGDESEETEHCYDALFGDFVVSYVESDAGFANALLTHVVRQQVRYDDRQRTDWQQLIAKIEKHTDDVTPTPNEPDEITVELG